MAKATKNTKPAKVAKTATTAKPQRVVRSAAVVQAQQQANPESAIYEVLQPFWFQGAVVKPGKKGEAPVFIEMTTAEARVFQDEGLLGTEPGEVPSISDTNTESEGTGETGNAIAS